MSMKAVILCGGQGTRIRDVASDIPKPMVRVGGRPILWHIMKIYANAGISDFVLCLGYKGEIIKQYFLDYSVLMSDVTLTLGKKDGVEMHNHHPELDWRVTLVDTGLNAQTGARIRKIREHVEDAGLFCVTYGDGLADIDLSKLIEFHRSHGRIGTVTGVRPQGRFGVMDTANEDEVDVVTEFKEKPQAAEGFINGGFFVFDQRLFDYLPERDDLVFERQPLGQLAMDGQLAMFKHDGFWQPMDTYREWTSLNRLWDSDDCPWKVWTD